MQARIRPGSTDTGWIEHGPRRPAGIVPREPVLIEDERRLQISDCLSEALGVPGESLLSPRELGVATSVVAARPDLWQDLVVPGQDPRWYALIHRSTVYDVWLLAWEPGHDTDWHDHGGSSGSFAVAQGRLTESYRRSRTGWVASRTLGVGKTAVFGPSHVHNVAHGGGATAVSVHAYSPPLVAMTYYVLTNYGLSAVETIPVDSPEDARRSREDKRTSWLTEADRRAIDELLAVARLELERPGPAAAAEAVRRGATLVDLRPAEERRSEGEIPGAVAIARNVLEWRLDPQSSARIPSLARYDAEIILMCSEGYASSLAAASLRRLGLARATDLDGGFRGWKAAGLPVAFSYD